MSSVIFFVVYNIHVCIIHTNKRHIIKDLLNYATLRAILSKWEGNSDGLSLQRRDSTHDFKETSIIVHFNFITYMYATLWTVAKMGGNSDGLSCISLFSGPFSKEVAVSMSLKKASIIAHFYFIT